MLTQTNGFGLFAAPAAQTDTSIALLWHKPAEAACIACYRITLNGRLHGLATCTDYTATGLAPATAYTCRVEAVTPDGRVLINSNEIVVSTKAQAPEVSVAKHGAVGDGNTLNTHAIQAAIDACPPGGRVIVPPGVFVTGALFLKSSITLYLCHGARLQGSSNAKDFPLMEYLWEGRMATCYASLLNTQDGPQHDITIEGEGVIDANGEALFAAEMAEGKGARGRAIALRGVRGVYLHGVTVRNSPAWCVHLIDCQDVSLNDVQIHTRYDEYGRRYKDIFNGDGFDPDSCCNVCVFHSCIYSQDDCIAIKSGRNEEGRRRARPSEHIRVTNCRFKYGFGVAVGSEMSGGVRNVLVQDCVFESTHSIASVKAPRGRGGIIENIVYDSCMLANTTPLHQDCRWYRGALYVDTYYSHNSFDPSVAEKPTVATPKIRNITFSNITLDTYGGNSVFLAGLPESPLESIRLENVQAMGSCGLTAYNVKGLALLGVQTMARNGEADIYQNVEFTPGEKQWK